MNGNTPYAGTPGTTQAGKRATADLSDLTAAQRRVLRENVTQIAARTRSFLPNEYVVDADVSQAAGGARATVAVQPPVGHPVSAGFTPEGDDFDDEPLITDDDEFEVARGLAASAALQVKQAVQDDVTPTAR
jgi:hypothetical protein